MKKRSVDRIPKGTYWAAVPHGIVDAAIPDTLKLLLWLCYDRPANWTYSVAEVAATMRVTKQCVRSYFRDFIAAEVFRRTGTKSTKHGSFPLYSFDRERVDAFVKSHLTVDPETDPETDVETNPETDPETGRTHTNTDLPKLITENNPTDNNGSENHRTKAVDASASSNSSLDASQAACGGVHVETLSKEDMKKAFEELEKDIQSQAPNPLMKEIKTSPIFKPRNRNDPKGLDDLFGFNPDA